LKLSVHCTLSDPASDTSRCRAQCPYPCSRTEIPDFRHQDESSTPPVQSCRLELLSWGFPKIPLHRDPDRASTPEWRTTLRLEDANFELVPPLPFLPASTASSARPLQVCCTLHPIMGFGPFRSVRALAPKRLDTPDSSPEPRFTPFRAFILADRRTASPRPLPSRRSTNCCAPKYEQDGPTSRPCSADESVIATRRCRRGRRRCSPGLRSPPGSSPNTPPPRPACAGRGLNLPWTLAVAARAATAALRRPTRAVRWRSSRLRRAEKADPHGVCDVKDRPMVGTVRSVGNPLQSFEQCIGARTRLAASPTASRKFVGPSGSPASSPLPRRGSTVSPSSPGSQVVGLPRVPPMVLTRLHRTFGGAPRARVPSARGPRDLHVFFRDRDRFEAVCPLHAVRLPPQTPRARALGARVSDRARARPESPWTSDIRPKPRCRPSWAAGSNSSPGVFQRCPSIEILTARPLQGGFPPIGSK
jgi:hypothetical protein